jgi:hypothetical protein
VAGQYNRCTALSATRLNRPSKIAKVPNLSRLFRLERAKGIEPSYAAWEAAVLPLNYARTKILLPSNHLPPQAKSVLVLNRNSRSRWTISGESGRSSITTTLNSTPETLTISGRWPIAVSHSPMLSRQLQSLQFPPISAQLQRRQTQCALRLPFHRNTNGPLSYQFRIYPAHPERLALSPSQITPSLRGKREPMRARGIATI